MSSPAAGTVAADAAVPVRVRLLPGWLLGVLGIVAVLVVVALASVLLTGRTVIAGADRRNQTDLAIAASGLEAWGRAVATVAPANFVRGRVVPLDRDERDYAEGWRYRAWLRHPTLDEFKIVYAVTTAAGCDRIRAVITAREGLLPFVRNYNDLSSPFIKIVDSFPLRRIWSQDTHRGDADAKGLRAYVGNIVGAALPADVRPRRDDVVCYAAGIPLARLLVLDRAARNFSTFMVVDAGGRVVAQIGSDPLPIASLDGLAPATPVLTQTLAATLGRPAATEPARPKLGTSLEPAELTVAGRDFVAYVRPFSPPPSFAACRRGADQPAQCLVVALMPRATIWRQALSLPLTIGAGLALAIGAVFALLPSLRLILLGPGEAIGRAEAIGVALGIPAMVSLATLAVLFAADVVAQRHAARTLAEAIATSAAEQAAKQIREATGLIAANTATTVAAFPLARAQPVSRFRPAPSACNRRVADRALVVDPAPVCRVADFCEFWPDSGLPVIDTIGLMNDDGQQVAGSITGACRGLAGGRANVSARDYFARLRTGGATLMDGIAADQAGTPRPYVLQHVVALQDGIAKSIIGMGVDRPRDYRPRRADRDRVYVTGGATLTSLIAPVLPPPFGLMIVDTRADALPVLLDPTPGRSGAEKLATMIGDGARVRDRLRALAASHATTAFGAFYDGADQVFVAAPIAGSRWVAIVHYAVADIDRRPARTVVKAAQSWGTFSIVFTVAWLAWLGWTRRRGWPRLWPQRSREDDYRTLAIGFALAAGGGLLAAVCTNPPAALVVGLTVRLAAAVGLHAKLGGKAGGSGKLRPATQRWYTRMLTVLVVCLSIVPMIGFWREARQFTADEGRRAALAQFTAVDGALETNRRIFARLRWAYGIDAPPPAPRAMPRRPRIEAVPGGYGVLVQNVDRIRPADGGGFRAFFSRYLAGWRGTPAPAPVAACPGPAVAQPVRLCRHGDDYGLDLVEPRFADNFDGAAAVACLFFAAGLMALSYWLLKRVLRALAGFGVPLEAVRYPKLFLGDLWDRPMPAGDCVRLARKSLLVNAPYIVLAMLRRGGIDVAYVNVADPEPAAIVIAEGAVVAFTGLELVLADRERRLSALTKLERSCAALAKLGAQTRSRLLILSELAPLERILDAFERDDGLRAVDTERENLRWSRLFEDFTTYNFRQPQLTAGPLSADESRQLTPDQRIAVDTVLAEARWLPQRIVSGGIGTEVLLPDAVVDDAIVPVDDEKYQAAFRTALIAWAKERDFPGRDAVRAHLRNQFVEYYQKLWSSSTNAEHVVLHNMAQSRFVNISSALAFALLVRRGIVILDPAPRLMNESFAMFVRQAEKLDTIRKWRGTLPVGAWTKARLPVFIAVGLAVATLVTVMILSGDQPTSLLPLLAAGIPALVAATQRLLRQP